MTILNLEFLFITAELFGFRAGPAFALQQNNHRRLFESAQGRSGPNEIVGARRSINQELTNSRKIQVLKPDAIALYLNQQPKDISEGFVFGTNPRSCDVLLANTQGTGISANHFSIRIDWVSRDPIVTCLSGSGLHTRVLGSKTDRILSKNEWLNLIPGTTTSVRVVEGLRVLLFSPTREGLQYNRNLQGYFLEFKKAVPELANISLGDKEVTPLILHRCPGVKGREYYTTRRIDTGDLYFDTKVFLYEAKCKPTPDATGRTPEVHSYSSRDKGYEDEDPLCLEWEGGQPCELFVVKHFQKKIVSQKKDLPALPDRFQELYRPSHMNLEDLVDFVIEPLVLMTVTSVFSYTTLHALYHEEPLSTKEAGYVLGQIFAALEYLHDHSWTHGNLDPRSIQVISRKELWIKLTDTALFEFVDLGKPNGYHATYGSQKVRRADQSTMDIWSAGVVALQLLLPSGLPHRKDQAQSLWVQNLESLAIDSDRKSGSDATALVRSVLKSDYKKRPTATKVLEHPWIVQNRRDDIGTDFLFKRPSPRGSRYTSVGPSGTFSRQGSAAPSTSSIHGNTPKSRHTSVGPSSRYNTQGSPTPWELTDYDGYARGLRHTSAGPSNNFSRQSSMDPTLRAALESHPDPGDEWNDFDSEPGTPYDSHNNSNVTGGRGSLRSQSRGHRSGSPTSDRATGASGLVSGQRQTRVEKEDSGGETETGERREPTPKKSRRGVVATPVDKNQKSREHRRR